LQEAIDCGVIAGCDPPLSVFMNQVLLHHEFPISVEWFADVREHRRIGNCEIAGNADGTNFNALKLVQIAGPLKPVHEPVFRDSVS
jgi:hypothetical protein